MDPLRRARSAPEPFPFGTWLMAARARGEMGRIRGADVSNQAGLPRKNGKVEADATGPDTWATTHHDYRRAT